MFSLVASAAACSSAVPSAASTACRATACRDRPWHWRAAAVRPVPVHGTTSTPSRRKATACSWPAALAASAVGAALRSAKLDAQTGRARRWNARVLSPAAPCCGVAAMAVHGHRLYVGGLFSRVGGRRRAPSPPGRTYRSRHTLARGRKRLGDGLSIDGHTLYVFGSFTRLGGHRRRRVAAVDLRNGRVTRVESQPRWPGERARGRSRARLSRRRVPTRRRTPQDQPRGRQRLRRQAPAMAGRVPTHLSTRSPSSTAPSTREATSPRSPTRPRRYRRPRRRSCRAHRLEPRSRRARSRICSPRPPGLSPPAVHLARGDQPDRAWDLPARPPARSLALPTLAHAMTASHCHARLRPSRRRGARLGRFLRIAATVAAVVLPAAGEARAQVAATPSSNLTTTRVRGPMATGRGGVLYVDGWSRLEARTGHWLALKAGGLVDESSDAGAGP